MRIHHLNCGTMCPFGARLINGAGGLLAPGRMVCHCLLVETARGLVLVDTGLGRDDVTHPRERLGVGFVTATRPRCDLRETAADQVERLGFSRADVRDIVVTHLDLDHAGGLSDFPDARVHVFAAEHDAALAPRTMKERERYRPIQFAHGPKWSPRRVEGERWFGFDAVRALDPSEPDVLLVPLHGHTRGHCGVAVRTSERWILHCGDAYFARTEMAHDRPHCPPGLALFQTVMAIDDRQRRENQRRLRELAHTHAADVALFSAHDPFEFDDARDAAASSPLRTDSQHGSRTQTSPRVS